VWWAERRKYVELITLDWRNKRVAKVSTDPKATTNYFEAHSNSLPFEVSPAFFRPDVILKYKTDKEKYTVGERDITCRAAWHLKAFDVNEAGQVFAYIRYLRDLVSPKCSFLLPPDREDLPPNNGWQDDAHRAARA
jgi:hypothetical protein